MRANLAPVFAVALFVLLGAIPGNVDDAPRHGSTAPCQTVRIVASLDPSTRTVTGTATCTLGRPAHLRIATYPRLLRAPESIDDVRHTWFYPAGFDAGDMSLTQGDTPLDGEGPWQTLGDYAAGASVTLQFTTKVPQRNGVFGERDGVFYMLGGWHPAFADSDAPVLASDITYEITMPKQMVGFVGATPVPHTAPRKQVGTFNGRFLPWLAAGSADVDRTSKNAVIVSPAKADRHDMPYDLRDITAALDGRSRRQLIATIDDGAAFADNEGIAHDRLLVVIAPLRERLVERFDGGIAVSDRAFHVLHIEVMLKLHRLALWRAQLATYANARTRENETHYDGLPAQMISETVGVVLRDALARDKYAITEYAPQLLERIAVTPEIDALIFAPQTTFGDAYYEALDETPQARLHIDDFDTELPRGKILASKMVDRIGDAGAMAVTQAYLASHSSWIAMLRAANDEALVSALRPWIGPTPVLNYVLSVVDETQGKVRVRVDATGPDADKVHEPITVRLRERKRGRLLEAARLGPGELTFPTLSKTKFIELDPYERLVQLDWPEGKTGRYDDRTPPRWRFLLNDVSGLFAITNNQVSANVDFLLRRVNDLRYAYGFTASYAPEAVGVGASATYKFGKPVTKLVLAERISASVAYSRLRANFDNANPGDLLSAGVSYLYDDRQSPYYGFLGKGLNISAAIAYGRDDRGVDYVFGTLGASVLKIWRLALGHAIVGRLRVDGIIGTPPPQSQLRLGGRFRGARGYESNEQRGDFRTVASTEYRHLLIGDERTDFGGIFMLTRVEGAFFADAVILPVDHPGCHRSLFTDVGYSVKFIGDILNVSPSSLAFDFGFPLNRCDDQDFRVPFTVYASFVQSFAGF